MLAPRGYRLPTRRGRIRKRPWPIGDSKELPTFRAWVKCRASQKKDDVCFVDVRPVRSPVPVRCVPLQFACLHLAFRKCSSGAT